MKAHRLNVGLFACVVLALPQGANASLVDEPVLVGFYQFNGIKPSSPGDNPASYVNPKFPGVSGWELSPDQANQGNGGSYDGTYGDGPATDQTPAVKLPPGDGSATIRNIPLAFYTSSVQFWIKNAGTVSIPLGSLYFDAAEPGPAGGLINQDVVVTSNLPGFVSMEYPAVAETGPNDFTDYSIKLPLGFLFNPGDEYYFEFKSAHIPDTTYDTDTIWIDNVGISAVPEPSSVLGLGCVLASGLMLSTRRKPLL